VKAYVLLSIIMLNDVCVFIMMQYVCTFTLDIQNIDDDDDDDICKQTTALKVLGECLVKGNLCYLYEENTVSRTYISCGVDILRVGDIILLLLLRN